MTQAVRSPETSLVNLIMFSDFCKTGDNLLRLDLINLPNVED